ncbi:MAG: ImmA/IrrE family metallo-endopeptidase, partial [Rectinemataceae bacterium]
MEIQFKVLKTEADYDRALADLARVFDAPAGTPEADQLDVLVLLIKSYEDEHYPIDAPEPREAIRFRMEQAGLSQKDLIPYIGSRSKVSEVLSGKRELTLAMIRSLNKHLGIPAEVLIREAPAALPKALADLDFAQFPLKEMEKNGAFSGFDLGMAKIGEKAEEAIRWLVGQIGGFQAVPQVALRKTDGMRLNAKLDNYALLGWSLQALKEAADHPPSGRFKSEALTDKFIETLVGLSVLDDGPRHAKEYLGKAGITLLALPHLAHTYLDGAVFLREREGPLIALTLRYDRVDNFWFVLLHELGHLKLGHLSGGRTWIADDLDLPDADSIQEREADDFASRVLLPEDFDLSSRMRLSSSEVVRYASDHGLHPAIVAGRIQHEKKDFRTFANLLGRGEVRKHFPVAGAGWSKAIPKE